MSDRKAYFNRAGSWASDRLARTERSLRLAWIIAGTAVAVAALEAVAIVVLTPLKTVQTVAMLVDRQTGYVQVLDPAAPPKLEASQALTRSFLAQYVTARESFDRATVAVNYRKVALWSTGQARTSYLTAMPSDGRDSPFNRYPAGAVAVATVKSVSQLTPDTALVRFDVGIDGVGDRRPVQSWIAVIHFRYTAAAMRFQDRLVNPLGFQVVSYRKDAETPPESLGTPDREPIR